MSPFTLTTVTGKPVVTYQDMINEAGSLNSRHTTEHPFILNGVEVWMYKHWSYDGTPEFRTGDNLHIVVATIDKFSNWYPVYNEDGTPKKCEHGVYDLMDCILLITIE